MVLTACIVEVYGLFQIDYRNQSITLTIVNAGHSAILDDQDRI